MKVLANILRQPHGPETGNNTLHIDIFDSAEGLAHYRFPRKNHLILSVVCVRGHVDLVVDSATLHLCEKSFTVILPGHLIESYKVSDDFSGFLFTASQQLFTNFLPFMSRLMICSMQFRENPVVKLSDTELWNLRMLHDLLISNRSADSTIFERLAGEKIAEAIFYASINVYFKRLEGNMTTVCNRSESLFYKFIVSVETNYMRERSVNFYANELYVSSKHLSAIVKDISGQTAGEWIDSYVINETKRLLSSSDLTIQEISCRLNFANQSFFGKYFKSHTGMSPREYRMLTFAR